MMRKKLLFCVMFLIGLVPMRSVAQSTGAKIVFEELEHNFGTFNEKDGMQSYNFDFVNKGSSPLIINNVHASCGCTTPEWTRVPVAPGKKGFIRVSYNPQNRPGSFHKTVMVSTNGANNASVLRISGKVIPRPRTIEEIYPRKIGPVRARTNQLSFFRIKNTSVRTDSLEIVNDSDKPVHLSFRTLPEHLTVQVIPEELKPHEKGNIIVSFDATRLHTYGFIMNRVYLKVDGKSDYRNSIGVSATIVEDFSKLSAEELANAPIVSWNENVHHFGDIKQGDKVHYTFVLKNSGHRNLIIRRLKTSCGCTVVSPEKRLITPGESVPLKVTFDSEGKRGRQNKAITVITNDPKQSTSILRISANVLIP